MKKVDDKLAVDRLTETLKSIRSDEVQKRLKVGDDAHPFFRVKIAPDDGTTIADDDLASLLVARLKAQGYTLLFDAELARQTLDAALSRLDGLLPKQ